MTTPYPQPGLVGSPSSVGTSVGGDPFGTATGAEGLSSLLTISGGGVDLGALSGNTGPQLQVWIPGTSGTPTKTSINMGEDGRRTVTSTTGATPGQWGDPDTARLIPYSWSAKEVADFIRQAQSYGYKVKTFGDAASLWSDLVDEAAKYGAVGRPISPYDVLKMHAGDNKSNAKQGPPTLDETSARASLESAMQSELGRSIASSGEVSSFQGAANGQLVANSNSNHQFDPSEYAVEYLRSHFGSESQAYRALGFYNAALSLIGGSGVPSGQTGG